MATGSHIYPIGSQLLWGFRLFISIALCLGPCLGGYLALYYYFGKDAELAAFVMFSMLATVTFRIRYDTRLRNRDLFTGPFFDIPVYGFIDAEGIHYRRYVRMHFAPWIVIHSLEYWPQDGGKINLYLSENLSFPIRFAPHPSWSQHTAEELKSNPPAAIRYVREHLHPSAFQLGVASVAPNIPPGVRIIDYLVAVGFLLLGVSVVLQWQTKAWHWAEMSLLILYLIVRIRWGKRQAYIIDPQFSSNTRSKDLSDT